MSAINGHLVSHVLRRGLDHVSSNANVQVSTQQDPADIEIEPKQATAFLAAAAIVIVTLLIVVSVSLTPSACFVKPSTDVSNSSTTRSDR